MVVVFLMMRRQPRSTRTDTLLPYTTLFRSGSRAVPHKMSALTSSEKSPVLRWRKLKADMHSPYERRHELYLGTAYIGVVEPSADGTYLARGQNGGPHETFSTLHLAKLCLEDRSATRRVGKAWVSKCRCRGG